MDEHRSHPPSARQVVPKKTKLTGVEQLRDVLRIGCPTEITQIIVSESAPDTISGDLVLRVVSLPAIAGSLKLLDLSFNDLTDSFWTHTDWKKAPRWPSLTALNIANNRFTEASLDTLQTLVARCVALKQLDLSINAIGYKLQGASSIQDLSRLFPVLPTSLESLDLSCLHVSDAQVAVLLAAPTSSSLHRLYLRSNDLSDTAANAIAEALVSHRLKALRVLSLAGNLIGDGGMGSLAFAIDAAVALETLDVEENQITDRGLQTLFHVLNGLNSRFPLRYLHINRNRGSRNPQLINMIQLKLQEKIVETCVTSPPLDASQSDASLQSLHLTGSYVRTKMLLTSVLTDHYVSIVLTAIRHHDISWTTLNALDLSGNSIGTAGAWEVGSFLSLLPPNLRRLNLSNNQINNEGVNGLADGIEWNSVLQELNLNDNEITDEGAKQLYLKAFTSNLQRKILLSEGNPLTSECKVMVAAISQAYDLRKRFARDFAHLEKLDFVGQRLRQYGAAAIAECLIATPTAQCTSLDLSYSMLGDDGAIEVAKLLRGFAGLTKLDLSFNEIGDVGALALADALRVNTTLTSLSIHSTIAGSTAKPKLTEMGLSAIAQALEKHKALTSLDLRDNIMAPGVIPVLVQTLQRNSRIQKFNGSSAAVFLSRNEP